MDAIGSSTRRSRFLPVLVATGLAVLFACSESGLVGPSPSLSVSPGFAGLFVGDTARLTARVEGSAPAAEVGWSSSDPSVALVDDEGLVEAVGPGKASIRAASGETSGEAEIQVNPAAAVNLRLSDDLEFPHQEEPHLAVDGRGRIYAAWKEMLWVPGFHRVAFSRSTDGGNTWSTPVLMERFTGSRGAETDPWLTIDEADRAYMSRVSAVREGGERIDRIVVSRTLDGGASWEPPVEVARGGDKESIASDRDGVLYLTYVDPGSRPAEHRLRLLRSDDDGQTWIETASVPEEALAGGLGPVLAPLPGGTVCMVWNDWEEVGNTLAAVSRDHGDTWAAAVRLNTVDGSVTFPGPIEGAVNRPPFASVAVHPSGRISAAWLDSATGNWDILVAHSDDGCGTWSAPVRINDVALRDQWMPAIAAGPDGTLHAVWYDGRTGDTYLTYAESSDGGDTWGTNIRVATEPTPGVHVRLGDYLGLAVDPNGVAHMLWTDGRDDLQLDIYYARSSDFPPGLFP